MKRATVIGDGAAAGMKGAAQCSKMMKTRRCMVGAHRIASDGLPYCVNHDPDLPVCNATKTNGEPCKAKAIARYGDGKCRTHHQLPEMQAALARARERAKNQGRKKAPNMLEELTRRVEERVDEILRELFHQALSGEKGIAVSGGKDAGYVEFVPDPDIRLRAIRELLDRAYGRPKQAIKVGGDGEAPIAISLPRSEERARQVAAILGQQGAIPHEGRRRKNAGTKTEATNGSGPKAKK
jgi:hypothetical protein